MDAAQKAEFPLGDLNRIPEQAVSIDSLVVAGSPRLSGENIKHTRALAELEDRLPPILVHRPTRRVLDGIHRLHAAKLRGAREIGVRFVDGDEASSFVLAVQANIAHGLPLTLSDRKAAASRIMALYPQWSDRAIASAAGLAHTTVAAMRGCPTGQDDQLDNRIGRDGRLRPRDPLHRREMARKMLIDKPNASLREIARAVNISPDTVRKVRAELASADVDASRQKPNFSTGNASATISRQSAHHAAVPYRVNKKMPTWQALRADPAFSCTESGRLLLRLLSAYQVLQEHHQQLIDHVPPHCIDRLAAAASECAQAWQDFADRAEQYGQVPRES
jgi:hypothetical protein